MPRLVTDIVMTARMMLAGNPKQGMINMNQVAPTMATASGDQSAAFIVAAPLASDVTTA